MPIGDPTPISVSYNGFLVSHANGVQFSVQIAPAQNPNETDGDAAVQSLIDYVAAWPDRDTTMGMEASKFYNSSAPITVTPEG